MHRLVWLLIGSLSPTVLAAPPTVEQVSAALDLAEQAAQHGLTDLSMSAVQRSLAWGPPTVSTTPQQTSLVHQGARVDTSVPIPIPPSQALQQRIPRTVLRLADIWRQQTSAPQVYDALRNIVLPKERPHEVFLYSLPVAQNALQPERMPVINSVAQELIRAAVEAGRLDDFQQQLMEAGANHVAEGSLLLLMCAIQHADDNAIQQYSETLRQQMQSGVRMQTAILTASAGLVLRQSGRHPVAAAGIMSASAETLATIGRHDPRTSAPVTAVLLAAARCLFAAEQPDEAVAMLQMCLADHNRPSTSGTDGDRTSRQRCLVARELFGRHLDPVATRLLGKTYASGFARRYQPTSLQPDADEAASNEAASNEPASTDSAGSNQSADVLRTARVLPANSDTSLNDVADHIWFCSLNPKTRESTLLWTLPDFQHVSSPTISSDGTQVAFEATFPGELITSGAAIYTVRLDGSRLQRLGPGTQPSWSPGSQRLVCNRYSPDRGVWILRSDGSSELLLDSTGWSSQWSPDGVRIAYTRSSTTDSEFVVYNVVEDQFSIIAKGKKRSPAQSSWNFCWTPDSQHVLVEATQGDNDNTPPGFSKISAITSDNRPLLIRNAQEWDADFLLTPDASRVMFAHAQTKSSIEQLLTLELTETSSPEPLVGQYTDRRNTGLSWMPDGRTLIYLSRPPNPAK
ncbi:MAG: hypothetical protein R3C59_12610 [Planctomycetaceae bacterium]